MQNTTTVTLGPRQCINCSRLIIADAIYCHYCGTMQPAPTLTLTLKDQSASFKLEHTGKAHVVGRTIESMDHFVQIDLGPHHGKQHGVSRTHAQFRFDEESWHWQLIDAGSQFGTFIDANQLQQDVPANMANGQVIRFGGIEVYVEIEYEVSN